MLELIDEISDADTFQRWSMADLGVAELAAGDPDYLGAVEVARSSTGLDEAVVVGSAQVEGHEICLIFGAFEFLAGSVGRTACQLIISAVRRAQELRLPILASPASGGTRMQEGTAAFVLMADVALAVTSYRNAGLPWLTWLRHPTTGGVMASWGSLGTVTFAQPGALVGFLGPRVYAALTGKEFPAGVQVAENLVRRGVIDGVADTADIRDIVGRLAAITSDDVPLIDHHVAQRVAPTELSAAAGVARSSDPTRLNAQALVDRWVDSAVPINGTTAGEASDAVSVMLGRWDGRPVVLAAQIRQVNGSGTPLGPKALRVVQRGIHIATELALPFVSIVDTAGAELSQEAEELGLAGEIARTLAALTAVPVPTVSILLGMGCGGGALAMLPADVVISAEDGWVAPLPLAGAAVIRYRDASRAVEMAEELEVGAWTLRERGIVDRVVGGEGQAMIAAMGVEVVDGLDSLHNSDPETRLRARQRRYSAGLV